MGGGPISLTVPRKGVNGTRTVAFPFAKVSLRVEKPVPVVCTAELKTLGDHLRARRLTLGLSRAEAAERLKVGAFTLGDWERGDHSPRSRYWPKILAFLEYDPHPEPETLAEEIAAVQRREGWTQAEFASALGAPPCTVWAWTTGRPPRRKHLREALQRVGVRLDDA